MVKGHFVTKGLKVKDLVSLQSDSLATRAEKVVASELVDLKDPPSSHELKGVLISKIQLNFRLKDLLITTLSTTDKAGARTPEKRLKMVGLLFTVTSQGRSCSHGEVNILSSPTRTGLFETNKTGVARTLPGKSRGGVKRCPGDSELSPPRSCQAFDAWASKSGPATGYPLPLA